MPQDDFQDISKAANARASDQLHDDLQNEIAGRDVGRQARFMPGEASAEVQAKKKRERAERILSALERLMRDPVYVAAYRDFNGFLRDRAIATQTAIERALHEQALARDHLSELDDKANRLPGGRKVFRTADGRVVDENGHEIDAQDAASIVWQDGAPSWEEYKAAKDAAENADRRLAMLYAYQNDLAESRERLENQNDPMTPGQMEAERERLERDAPDFTARTSEKVANLGTVRTARVDTAKPIL